MHPRIEPLLPIVEKWKAMNAQFSKAVTNEAAYWRSERANCGMLSAAAWLEGGYSLNVHGDENSWQGESYRGRVDLWIQTRTGESYVIEAKRDWLWDFDSANGIKSQLMKALKRACKDAARVKADPGDHRVGILFAVPGFKPNEAEAVRVFHEARNGLDDVDIHEWIEPEVTPFLHGDGRHYPGVLLLGKLAGDTA